MYASRLTLAWVLMFVAVLVVGGFGAGTLGPAPARAVTPSAGAATPMMRPFSLPLPFPTDMAASIVLGQPNLSANSPGPSTGANSTNFRDPGFAMAFDARGDLWVADWSYNRVLEFVPPFTNGMSASVVLGQSTFAGWESSTTPTNLSNPDGLAFDANGNLWVAESGNNRVVEFPYPFSNGEAATTVIGQTSFTTSNASVGAAGLRAPAMIAFRSGNLWVADYSNNRVLEFLGPTITTGESASLVLGQQNFSGSQPGTSAVNESHPGTVAFDAFGNLWLADDGNNRAIEYPLPFASGEAATVVLGQANLTTSSTPATSSLADDNGISVDASGNIWIADSGHNRVLEYHGPTFFTNETPVAVLGQSGLGSTVAASGPSGLSYPTLALQGPQGRMWIDDETNYRVLAYVPSIFPVHVVESGLPSGMGWSAILNGASQTGVGSSLSFSVANGSYSLSVPPVAGYSADPAYAPVVVDGSAVDATITFVAVAPDAFSTGMAASIVLGQPNLWANQPATPFGTNASNFIDPGYAIAFDSHGDLWVADGGANRVLEFIPPFTTDMNASVVLGQSSFSGWQSGVTATNLSYPDGLAFDPSGNLWVSDFSNNRVVEFAYPFSNGEAASRVLGQGSFTTSTGSSGPATLNGPSEIAFHGADLWVADYYDNRIVEYTGPSFTTGQNASLVLGQQDLSGYHPGTTAVNLSLPSAVAFDGGGNLWVADFGNNRAVEYPAPLSTGEAATVVLGQANLTTSSTTGNDAFSGTGGVFVDSSGNLWIADSGNNRVLEYRGPAITTGESPSVVLGQGNLSTTLATTGPSGLYYPTLAIVGPHGQLWVDDEGNARVLGYTPVTYHVTFQATGSALPASWSLTVNGTASTVTGTSTTYVTTNGSVSWNASASGWILSPSQGTAVVNGANVTVTIAFASTTADYAVTFTEGGLASGTNWSVTLGGTTEHSTTNAIVFTEPNGTFDYTVATVAGYAAPAPASGTVTVSGQAQSVNVSFTPSSYAVTFTETGLASGTNWSVTLDGITHTSVTASIVFTMTAGSYAYSVAAVSGYDPPSPSSGTVQVTGTSSVSIAFSAVATTPASSGSGSLLVYGLVAVAVVVVLVVLALLLMRRRRRGPPTVPPGPPMGSPVPPPDAKPPAAG